MTLHGASRVVLLLCLGACSSAPPLRIYLLTPPLQLAAPAPTPASPTAHIAIRRVLVPDYLDTTDILLRDGTNEVKVSTTGRWGERLSYGLTRALAADLGSRLPSALVSLEASDSKRQVLVNVNALDIWPDGRCAMAASWSIVDHAAARAVAGGSGTFDSSPMGSPIGMGDERLVDAMSRTVGKLADAIVLNIGLSTERSGRD